MILALLAATVLGGELTHDNMFNLACMHGEDWIISTEGFYGIQTHLRRQVSNMNVEDPDMRERLYYEGMDCAIAIGAERGMKPPPGWQVE